MYQPNGCCKRKAGMKIETKPLMNGPHGMSLVSPFYLLFIHLLFVSLQILLETLLFSRMFPLSVRLIKGILSISALIMYHFSL